MPTETSDKDLKGMIVSTLSGLPKRKWDRISILDSNFTTCFGALRGKSG